MVWSRDACFGSVVHFCCSNSLGVFFFLMGCPMSAFERASMDWILSQGLLIAKGFFSVCW